MLHVRSERRIERGADFCLAEILNETKFETPIMVGGGVPGRWNASNCRCISMKFHHGQTSLGPRWRC